MMTTLKAIFLIFGLCFSFQSFASSTPVRQIRLSIYNLSETPTGRTLLSNFYTEENNYDPLFEILSFSELNNKLLFDTHMNGQNEKIYYNAHLGAAAPYYVTWVLAQALVKHRLKSIALTYGITDLPKFYETSVWELGLAAKVWRELGSPNSDDYYYHGRYGWFPKGNHSSVSQFDHLWRTDKKAFVEKVIQRHFINGYGSVYLKDAIKEVTGPRRAAYQAILDGYNQFKDREGLH